MHAEKAGLFPDLVFHIGADETFVSAPPCDLNNTEWLERKIVNAVANNYHKIPAGWEQVRWRFTWAAPPGPLHLGCSTRAAPPGPLHAPPGSLYPEVADLFSY